VQGISGKIFRRQGKNPVIRQGRRSAGYQLVEVLVSVVLSGIMMAAIMGQMTKSQSFSTKTKNQVMASDIIQEIVDNARNLSWNELTGFAGTHTLRVNQLSSGQVTDLFFPRALQLDPVALTYSTAGSINLFRGDVEDGGLVQAVIVNGGAGTVQLDVTVTWYEPGGIRTSTARTIIAQTGIHN